MTRSRRALALAVATAALAGCGSSGSGAEVTVSAASSLSQAFPAYAENVLGENVHFSFGGSDVLAAQIREGARPDVFASANTEYPQQLYKKGLVDKPVDFARNRLVIAIPAGSAQAVQSVADLAKPGLTIAMGDRSVPIGSYTREVLSRLPAAESKAILGNVASNEPDASGIVGKLTQGAVDAGFVYASDAKAAANQGVQAIDLPQSLQPNVTYAIAVVQGGPNPAAAQDFVDGLRSHDGQMILQENGFLPKP